MSLPAFYDYLLVLFYDGFYERKFLFLESVIVYQFDPCNIVFCLLSILQDMHMHWLMALE